MKYPKITIVTPSYNQGKYIERTILSILNQDYPNLEYLVCDGGSTDTTVEILKRYDNRIDWWCSEKDKGQTHAINKGMKRATGDIVGWINSDDMLLPGALYVVADFFHKHPETDFANGYTVEIDENDKIINFTHIVMSKFLFRKGAYNISQQGMFWKRELFNDIGYLDETFHAKMDAEWLIRVYEAGKTVKRIDKNLGAIRIYANTKTALGGNIWVRDYNEIYKRYNGAYSPRKNSIYNVLLWLYKIISGCRLKNLIMKLKYKGKNVTLYNENIKKV